MLLWEYAIPVAGRIIGSNPFDQPDVESAKQAARDMLGGAAPVPEPAFTDGPLAVFGSDGLLTGETTVEAALEALLARLSQTGEHSYLAVMAYLNRATDTDLVAVRESLAARTGRPTTFGWGPRFLHSTGQYHKGGAPTGVFLQITDQPREDLAIPGQSFTFGDFIHAQAVGDACVLASHGRPVLRLHLLERKAGLDVVRRLLG
jgi:glucose-6-phosphate isomerase